MNKLEIISAIIELEDRNTLLEAENSSLKEKIGGTAKSENGTAVNQNIISAVLDCFDLDDLFDGLNENILDPSDGSIKESFDEFVGDQNYFRYSKEAQTFSKYCSLRECEKFFKERLLERYGKNIADQKKAFAEAKKKEQSEKEAAK